MGRLALVVLGLAAATLCACGGDSSSGSSGPFSTAGAGGVGTGGTSGIGSRPPAQGSLTLAIGLANPATPGYACPISGKSYALGDPPPTQTSAGIPLIDGQGVSVTCSVIGNGSYAFNATLSGQATGGAVQVAFSAPMVGTKGSSSATASVYTSDLADTLASDQASPCSVSVLADQIKPGVLWAGFSCPSLKSAPSTECAAQGLFVFQDCASY
ncbi:MAG TPA: hypothetical protein VGI10_03410 [Polyangiaceae bacterium]